METYLGIEIGGTKLQLLLAEAEGKILERRKLMVEPAEGGPGIRRQIERALPELIHHARPSATGVGFGGPVDWQSGKICRSHQVEGWSEFDLASWLRPLTGNPVFVDNDANVAALGEAIHGAGKGLDPVFYVTLGSGVGGGLILRRQVYHGAVPGEAEIGHVRLNRNGTTVESRCSGWAIDARIRDAIANDPAGVLARLAATESVGQARFLPAALQQQDPTAQRILHELTEDLAFGLSHVVHLFHPQVIVLGGGLSKLGEPLRSGVQRALKTYVMDAFAPGPAISLAGLSEDAVPIGAVELAKLR